MKRLLLAIFLASTSALAQNFGADPVLTSPHRLIFGDPGTSAAAYLQHTGTNEVTLTGNLKITGTCTGGCGAGMSGLTLNKILKAGSASSAVNSSFSSENAFQPLFSATPLFPYVSTASTTLNAYSGLNQQFNAAGTNVAALSNPAVGAVQFIHDCSNSAAITSVQIPTPRAGNLDPFSFVGANQCAHYPIWYTPNNQWDYLAEPHVGLTGSSTDFTHYGLTVQYAGAGGADTADGATAATPVQTVYQAILNLLVGSSAGVGTGGTIYVTNGAFWSPWPEGLHLIGAGDANYAGCATTVCVIGGLHYIKMLRPVRIIGLGGAFSANSDQPATDIGCTGNCNAMPTAQPVWSGSGIAAGVYMANIIIEATNNSPSMTWGIGSDGSRAAGGSNATFDNLQVNVTNIKGNGPSIDMGGNTFEVYFHHCLFTGSSAEAYSISSCARLTNVVTCTIASGTFSALVAIGSPMWLNGFADASFNGHYTLTGASTTTATFAQTGPDKTSGTGSLFSAGSFGIQINPGAANSSSITMRDSHVNTGGISYTTGTTNWGLIVQNTYEENAPANSIGIAIDAGGTPGNATLDSFLIADGAAGSVACEIFGANSTSSDIVLGTATSCLPAGGTILQTYPGNYGFAQSSIDSYNEVGFYHNHVIGATDAVWRNFPPALVQYANVASTIPGNWALSGLTLTTVTGPDTIANGAGSFLAGGGQGTATFGSINTTWAAGDFVAAGVIEAGVPPDVLSTAPARVTVTAGSCVLNQANGAALQNGATTSAQFVGYMGGDGEWVRETHVYQIRVGGVCTLAFQGLVNANKTQKFANPIFFRVATGGPPLSEISEYVEHMIAYPDTASVGDVTMGRKQRFSMSDPQSNFFAKWTSQGSGLTADRTFSLPDASVYLGASPVNAQTGTTYTFADGDRGKLVTFTNGSAIAAALPQAGASTTFLSGWYMDVQNRGAGTLTITPTTSTIDGAATLALTTSNGARIFSDGANYFTQRGISGASSPVTSVFTRTGGVVAAANDYTLDLIGNPAAAKAFTITSANLLSLTGSFNGNLPGWNVTNSSSGSSAAAQYLITNNNGAQGQIVLQGHSNSFSPDHMYVGNASGIGTVHLSAPTVILDNFSTAFLSCTSSGCATTGTLSSTGNFTTPTTISGAFYNTATNCASSGGTCAAASAGRVSIAAAATTVTVATTAVTATSEIFIQEDSSLGTALSVTCNTTLGRNYVITARTAATSFVITTDIAPITNPACLSYRILN